MNTTETPPWRKRKWLAAGLIAALLAAGYAAVRWSTRAKIEGELTRIRQAGLPTSTIELDQWYLRWEQEENAALLVVAAAESFEQPARDFKMGRVPLDEPLSQEWREEIGRFLEANREALEKLHRVGELRGSRYPIDLRQGPATLLPHLSQVKQFAQFLRMAAIYYADGGEIGEAVRCVESGFALASTLGDEPILTSEMVRVACVKIMLDTLEAILNNHSLEEAQLARLQEWMVKAELDGNKGQFRALAGERGGAVELFRMSYGELLGMLDSGGDEGMELVKGSGVRLAGAAGVRDLDLRIYLDSMEEIIAASTNDFPERLVVSRAAHERAMERMGTGIGRLALVSKMILPALQSFSAREALIAADLRCARLGMGVERYWLERGEWPESLNDLSDDRWGGMPKDPYTGGWLHYERLPNGYLIQSAEDPEARAGAMGRSVAGEFRVERQTADE